MKPKVYGTPLSTPTLNVTSSALSESKGTTWEEMVKGTARGLSFRVTRNFFHCASLKRRGH